MHPCPLPIGSPAASNVSKATWARSHLDFIPFSNDTRRQDDKQIEGPSALARLVRFSFELNEAPVEFGINAEATADDW